MSVPRLLERIADVFIDLPFWGSLRGAAVLGGLVGLVLGSTLIAVALRLAR